MIGHTKTMEALLPVKADTTFNVLWQTFRNYRVHIAVLVGLGFLSALLEGVGINAAIPLLSFLLGDGGATQSDFISESIRSVFSFVGVSFQFRYLLAFILALFILRSVSVVVFGYLRTWITADFLYSESERMMHRALSSSWPFFLKQKLGHIHNSLIRDVQRTSNLLAIVSQIIQSGTGMLMYLLVAINISPTTTLFTALGGTVLLLVVRPLLKRSKRAGEAMAQTEKRFSQFLSEHIIGMKTLKAAAAEGYAAKRGASLLRYLRLLSIRLGLISSVSSGLFQPFILMFVIVVFALTYNTPGFSIISFALLTCSAVII